MPAAGGDRALALRLYLWNARLCEALYLPLQLAEVACRNAIVVPVVKRFGNGWFADHRFENILEMDRREALRECVRKERKKRGKLFTPDHLVASLPFGFWVYLMTSRYDRHLWATGVKVAFPFGGKGDTRESIYGRLEGLRRIRNDVMHHYAVFDKRPQAEALNAHYLIGMVCRETEWFSQQAGTITRVINERPKV